MPNAFRGRLAGFFFLLGLLPPCATAQNIPGSGWNSFGVLPFRGYDFVLVRAPSQYILYFQLHIANTPEGAADTRGRAFSADLKTWVPDTRDICSTSGDYCTDGNRAGAITLPDGRMRMYFGKGDGSLNSAISTDGIVWAKEAGQRLSADPSSIYERGGQAGSHNGNFVLDLVSLVTLPNGAVRMYYEGGVLGGSAGTPSYYNNDFYNGVILSALSNDAGLTFVREGVRINPMFQGPANGGNQFNGADVSAVAVQENGATVYRIYAPSLTNGAVSYVSSDGLNFTLEGSIPAAGGDPKAFIMPDGRTWLVSNASDALADTLVYGPQTFTLNSVRAAIQRLPISGFAAPFRSVLMGVSGTAASPITFEAAAGNTSRCASSPCTFHPEYYSFAPAGGTPPLSTLVTYTGPDTYGDSQVVIHARSADASAAGSIDCMARPLGLAGNEVYCSNTVLPLPLNKLLFAFSGGSVTPVSQSSTILSLGGTGYPFTASANVPWIKVTPIGTAPAPIQVTVDPASLAKGLNIGVVTVVAEGTSQTITVNATVAAGPVITAIQNAAAPGSAIAPNSFFTIYGSGFASAATTWQPVSALPTQLAGVGVKVNGQDGYISYADTGQINVLAPASIGLGQTSVTVTTAAGAATSGAFTAAAYPAWFTYNVNGPTWLAAQIAGTTTLVAPVGTFGPEGNSRPAKAGDFLALYANGLGATSPAAPSGIILTTAYYLDDLSRVKLTIGGQAVPVLFAGLVGSGLYQINIQVPPNLPSGAPTGELPVVMTVDGIPTQTGVTLNFQ